MYRYGKSSPTWLILFNNANIIFGYPFSLFPTECEPSPRTGRWLLGSGVWRTVLDSRFYIYIPSASSTPPPGSPLSDATTPSSGAACYLVFLTFLPAHVHLWTTCGTTSEPPGRIGRADNSKQISNRKSRKTIPGIWFEITKSNI